MVDKGTETKTGGHKSMSAKGAMTATVASDKETKNTRRFTIPQEDMTTTGFSGSVYLGKDTG
jgi:hypothetical protein